MSRTKSCVLVLVGLLGCSKTSVPPKGAPEPAVALFTDLPPTAQAGSGQTLGTGGQSGAAVTSAGASAGGSSAVASAGAAGSSACEAKKVTGRSATEKASEVGPKIVGGHRSHLEGVVAFTLDGKQNTQFCGGSLIHEQWVLTAAHCKIRPGHQAIVGLQDLRKVLSDNVVGVDFVLEHARYNQTPWANDIALVRLTKAMPSAPRIQVLADDSTGNTGIVAGWGYTAEGGARSPELLEVDVPLVNQEKCKEAYGEIIIANMLCAGKQDKDSCQGDSGGPIGINGQGAFWQLGIVSFGEGCGRDKKPGVYTRVSKYRDWIEACMK